MARTSPRPIRLRPRVRDEDRKRAARACWTCRDRKSRCIIVRKSNGEDICQRCLKDGRECNFGEFPGDMSPSDEPRQYIPGANLNDSSASTRSSQPRPSKDGTRPSFAADPMSLHAPEGQLVVKTPYQTHYVGVDSNGNFISKVRDAVVPESPHEARRDISSDYFQQSESYQGHDAELLQKAFAGFPPKSVADFLVLTFFHSVEANHYYMDRAHFKERLEKCYQMMASGGTDFDTDFVCLALMVFAMGSQFAELRAPMQAKPTTVLSKHGPGMVFYTKAKTLLSDVITACSLESIQVCFLIGIFLLPSNTSDLSYVYHGMAMKIAISAGLHRRVGNTNLSPRVLQVRNRLWWSLFNSERRLTIILDRPESFRIEESDTPLPQYSEALDLPETDDNAAHLRANIGLTQIFNPVVRTANAMDFAEKAAAPRVAEAKRDLESWLQHLPPKLQLNNLRPDAKSFRGAVHLHMSYNQIIVYMGRAVLLRRIQRHLRPDQTPSPAKQGDDARSVSEREEMLSRDCVAAAYKMVDLVRFLSECKKLARFSFNDMNSCSIAAIIVIVHEVLRPHPLYSSAISIVMTAMKYMSTGCQNAKHALRLIQNLQAVVAATLKTRERHETTFEPPQGPQSLLAQPSTGYQQWENWISEAGMVTEPAGPQDVADGSTTADRTPAEWQHADTPSDHRDGASLLNTQVFGSAASYPGPDGALGTGVYNWTDDWNSLGLNFDGLEFPGL